MKISARYQEFVGEPSKQMNETGAAIKRLNRETLDRILAKLSADNAGAVRRAFNLRAFPDVYTDELAMEQRLNDALKLPDLSPEQQRRLGELAAEYRSAYASLSDQMVEISASGENPSFSGDDTEGWKKWQERREAVENLKFDRNELNLRAISQVRAMLSEDHIRRIGGLPEPKKKDGFEMW